MVFEQKGLLDPAIAQYVQALKAQPNSAQAHFNLGVARTRRGQLDEAIGEFQQALKLKPNYAAAQTNLAAVLAFKKSREH